jgi:hypothetical protein
VIRRIKKATNRFAILRLCIFALTSQNMRIMARDPGVMDGIYRCADCGGPMVKIDHEFRCIEKAEPEELVAAGLIPSRDSSGKLVFDLAAKDQQSIQATQALSKSVEIDNAYLEKLDLDLEKIRQYQLKLNRVP